MKRIRLLLLLQYKIVIFFAAGLRLCIMLYINYIVSFRTVESPVTCHVVGLIIDVIILLMLLLLLYDLWKPDHKVTGYRLNVQSSTPDPALIFSSSPQFHTGSVAHQTCCPLGIGYK